MCITIATNNHVGAPGNDSSIMNNAFSVEITVAWNERRNTSRAAHWLQKQATHRRTTSTQTTESQETKRASTRKTRKGQEANIRASFKKARNKRQKGTFHGATY